MGEVEKNSFIALPAKGRHGRLVFLQTVCCNLGGFGEKFYSDGSRLGLLRINVCAGPASFNLASGGLLMSILRLSNCDFLSGISFCFLSFLSFFFFGCTATYGILVPEPGIEPMPPAWKHSLNHWKSQCDLLSGMKNTSSTLPLIDWEI